MKEKLEENIRNCKDIKSKIVLIKNYLDIVEEDEVNVSLTIEDFINSKNELYDKDILNLITEEDIMDNIDSINLNKITELKDLSYDFILKNKDFISFDRVSLSNYIKLSIEEIKTLVDYVDWDMISLIPLNIDMIREFKDNLNWGYVSTNYIFEEDELFEFINLINWEYGRFVQKTDNLPNSILDDINNMKELDKVKLLEVISRYSELSLKDKSHLKLSKILEKAIKDFKD